MGNRDRMKVVLRACKRETGAVGEILILLKSGEKIYSQITDKTESGTLTPI
jgi:hypothetical protein